LPPLPLFEGKGIKNYITILLCWRAAELEKGGGIKKIQVSIKKYIFLFVFKKNTGLGLGREIPAPS
jgi:hypothetical protein